MSNAKEVLELIESFDAVYEKSITTQDAFSKEMGNIIRSFNAAASQLEKIKGLKPKKLAKVEKTFQKTIVVMDDALKEFNRMFL